MTLGQELCRKYALTSLKPKGGTVTLLAINEVLEVAATIADEEGCPVAARAIRSLKWVEGSQTSVLVRGTVTLRKAA